MHLQLRGGVTGYMSQGLIPKDRRKQTLKSCLLQELTQVPTPASLTEDWGGGHTQSPFPIPIPQLSQLSPKGEHKACSALSHFLWCFSNSSPGLTHILPQWLCLIPSLPQEAWSWLFCSENDSWSNPQKASPFPPGYKHYGYSLSGLFFNWIYLLLL